MRYPISTSIHLFFSPDSTALNAQIARHIDAGFRYLDFNFLDWATVPDAPLFADDDTFRRWMDSAGETAARGGARFNQAHAPYPVLNLKSDLAAYEAACVRAFDGCRILGVPWMVFHYVEHPENFGTSDKWALNVAFFRRMLAHAHRTGVGIAIENLHTGGLVCGTACKPVDYAIALADELNDPLVGICCDTGHCHIAKYNRTAPTDSLNPADAIRKIGPRLKALHIHDNNTSDDEHIPPFYGTIDWPDVMRALAEIQYAHSFTFESHNATRRLPDALRDEAARLLHRTGEALVQMNA